MAMVTVSKKYHFYAAHRNQNLRGSKCYALHGHTYYMEVSLTMDKNPESGVTILFEDIDKIIDPVVKDLDHSIIIDVNDPLFKYLSAYEDKEAFKFYALEQPTSVENLCEHLMHIFKEVCGLPVSTVAIKETTTSTVSV